LRNIHVILRRAIYGNRKELVEQFKEERSLLNQFFSLRELS
jgi:hypothetical protein